MAATSQLTAENRTPTRKAAAIFRFKSVLLQIRRFLIDLADPRLSKIDRNSALLELPVIAESRSRLWTEDDERERRLVAGKIQNLRVAVARIDGLEIGAGEVFSFWKNLGRTTRRRGFAVGRELREGCIIPNVGGGLCQLSNALYDGALKANLEIVERHSHTSVLPGSLAETGRDATVFWNYIDLRFRSDRPFRIEANLTEDHLSVKFKGARVERQTLHAITRVNGNGNAHVNSCVTCGNDDCFRAEVPAANAWSGKTAFLVDEVTPEFDSYIQATRTGADQLYLPLDGQRFGRANYAWNTGGFAAVKQSRYITGVRSYRSRRLAAQGAARQLNLLAMYERLAGSYARRLSFDVLHLVVQQQLLPFLWRSGHLGGRTFDVLMTALPIVELQSRLDAASKLHPDSSTLGDFRADPDLVAAETDALAAGRRIITPHSDIASLFQDRAELLEWKVPEVSRAARSKNERPTIVFPASTVGRKGCYELREAIRDLDIRLLTLGPYIESPDFWQGFDVKRGGDDWPKHADLVVLPAFVEHRPRRLLIAAASGIHVIATPACGVPDLTIVPAGDADALRDAIQKLLE